MNRSMGIFIVVFAVAILAPCLNGCAGKRHAMPPSQEGVQLRCRLCFDEAVKVRRLSGPNKSHHYRNVVIRKHHCPECNTEVTIYGQDGKPMIRCAGCTPEGVPCDRCLPPA